MRKAIRSIGRADIHHLHPIPDFAFTDDARRLDLGGHGERWHIRVNIHAWRRRIGAVGTQVGAWDLIQSGTGAGGGDLQPIIDQAAHWLVWWEGGLPANDGKSALDLVPKERE